MASPTDKAGIRILLGMINFLAAHMPNISTITAPLQSLLKSDALLTWGPEQEKMLNTIKEILSTARYFDQTAISTIQADASQFGLGSMLTTERQTCCQKPECNCAQELSTIVFACQKFHQYIYGFETIVQSDHKTLESIVHKLLHKVSPRLQRIATQTSKL